MPPAQSVGVPVIKSQNVADGGVEDSMTVSVIQPETSTVRQRKSLSSRLAFLVEVEQKSEIFFPLSVSSPIIFSPCLEEIPCYISIPEVVTAQSSADVSMDERLIGCQSWVEGEQCAMQTKL